MKPAGYTHIAKQVWPQCTDGMLIITVYLAFLISGSLYDISFTINEPPALMTTMLVIAEGHGWFLKRYDRTKAMEFVNMVEVMRPLAVTPVGPHEQKVVADEAAAFGTAVVSDPPYRNSIKTEEFFCFSDVS